VRHFVAVDHRAVIERTRRRLGLNLCVEDAGPLHEARAQRIVLLDDSIERGA
jgi:hypothetical protein